eukprot:3659233-Prymnesium_polylepis.1
MGGSRRRHETIWPRGKGPQPRLGAGCGAKAVLGAMMEVGVVVSERSPTSRSSGCTGMKPAFSAL